MVDAWVINLLLFGFPLQVWLTRRIVPNVMFSKLIVSLFEFLDIFLYIFVFLLTQIMA